MKEVIVKLTSDHIKVKGGEYVQDFVRCEACKFWAGYGDGNLDDWERCKWRIDEATDPDDFCSYGEVRDE